MKKNYTYRATALNPLILIIYGITCFYLYSLFQYGGIRRKMPIILVGGITLFLWFIWCFYRTFKKKKTLGKKEQSSSKIMQLSKIWYFIAIFILLSTTIVTGVKIYQSGVNYQGKLAWFIQDLKNKREIKFIHKNIYDDSLNGIFEDIEKKITLPDELYIANEFQLNFDNGGEITSLYTFLYGKDDDGETQSYLIHYDRNKEEDIIVRLKGYVDATFDEEMKLQPLMELIQWISLEEAVGGWNEEQYGILYYGVRSWGYNREGIIYIDENGEKGVEIPEEEIMGYTVSVYVPGKQERITPLRYIHNNLKVFPKEEEIKNQWEMGYDYNDGEETYFLNEHLGYQLTIVDAALGSRFYGLLQTQDGGETWETINSDPFLNNTGVSSGITFINEDLGFIGISHNGGTYAALYRTVDGGLTFEEVSIPEQEVELSETETYNPFDFPDMPYEEEGELYLSVGQGADGDYEGGIKALYKSEDNGKTWKYVE